MIDLFCKYKTPFYHFMLFLAKCPKNQLNLQPAPLKPNFLL